jgi:SEFIR domain-containing protein
MNMWALTKPFPCSPFYCDRLECRGREPEDGRGDIGAPGIDNVEVTGDNASAITSPAARPRVFISYSHDSRAHAEKVVRLSESLRRDGCGTELDQYVGGSPQRGWAQWMVFQLQRADFVLMVCTETYYRRFMGKEEPGKGRGSRWEGRFIIEDIYESEDRASKFVPVFFADADERFIPEPVRGQTRYCLTSSPSYERLRDFLLNQSGYQPGPIGSPPVRARPIAPPLDLPLEPPDNSDAPPSSEA